MSNSTLTGRVALVSGGGRGIGQAIAMRLAAEGATVAVNYRKDADAAEQTVERIRSADGTARAYRAAVEDPEQVEQMTAAIIADFGHIDMLVCNAGISSRGATIADTSLDDLERVLRTMAFGSHHLCRCVLPSMREQPRGDVIVISSQAAIQHNAFGAPYNMAKAAQESLAFTLAKEEAKNGIRVNVVSAGLVNTDMGRKVARAAAGVEDIHDLNPRFPLGRVSEPEDIAAAVSFLVAPGSEQITGQRIAVDAGGFG